VRYEHPAPGDLLHLDIKGMTRYQQVSIRGDRRRRGRPQFAGWQALHVAIDDHSRLVFSRMLPNQQSQRHFLKPDCACALWRKGRTVTPLPTSSPFSEVRFVCK
jgi:hypothetical protein